MRRNGNGDTEAPRDRVRTRLGLLAVVAFLPALASGAGIPDSVDGALIANYVVAGPGVAGAGQPSSAGLARLKELGFRTVVNLRVEGEGGYVDEKAILEAQGLRYVHVPLTATTLSEADIQAVRAVLDDAAARPVLIHCTSASRVGAVWAVIQRRQGKTVDEAEAEGRRVGMKGSAMTSAVRRLLEAAPQP
jgi:uncharacterized protein (TIGR01244 family)